MGRDRWVADDYAERLARDMQLGKPLAVAWDPGNGAAGAVPRKLCDRLPGRHVIINEVGWYIPGAPSGPDKKRTCPT